jgi:hypothetical protein
VGLCARRAFEVLRYARLTGDRQAYEKTVKTLARMETFRVPRAAQVWEVPVHTPDILAAADAVDAYVEAYRISKDPRWLENAVLWARRGLPFVYFWRDPDLPFLLGGSIPVFGATFYRGSWFGRPVQWNGLRYANALLSLDEYDASYPWRTIAETIIVSALYQQDADGENVALWPDNISAIDAAKCPWVFAPRQIIRNILKLTGRNEDPMTRVLRAGIKRIHVSTTARIDEAVWDTDTIDLRITYPENEQGVVLVANIAKPRTVMLDGAVIPERADLEKGDQPGWRYDGASALLGIRVAKDGESQIRVEDVAYREVNRLPRPVSRIEFTFDEPDIGTDGWLPAHHIGELVLRDDALCGRVTGVDPYMVRPALAVDGATCPTIVLRMRITAGQGGQLFWQTKASPLFDEVKSVRFDIRADGAYHEYRVEVGNHPQWTGQTITSLRLDPGNAAQSAEFALDYLRVTQN